MSFPQFLIALPAFPPLCCPSFLSLFLPLPLPLRHRNLPQALHLSGLSACFFIWLVATGGSTLADYNSAASHFRFIRAPTHTHSLPPPFSLPHLSLYTHYPHQRQSRQHSNPSSHRCRTNLHTPLLPPTFHIFHFDQRRKFSSRDEKEKEVGEERNIVAVEAFKLERQLELYYYLGLCHW